MPVFSSLSVSLFEFNCASCVLAAFSFEYAFLIVTPSIQLGRSACLTFGSECVVNLSDQGTDGKIDAGNIDRWGVGIGS